MAAAGQVGVSGDPIGPTIFHIPADHMPTPEVPMPVSSGLNRRLPTYLTFLLAALATTQLVGDAAAGVIVDHNATSFDARYDRFASGFPTAPVPNTSPTLV